MRLNDQVAMPGRHDTDTPFAFDTVRLPVTVPPSNTADPSPSTVASAVNVARASAAGPVGGKIVFCTAPRIHPRAAGGRPVVAAVDVSPISNAPSAADAGRTRDSPPATSTMALAWMVASPAGPAPGHASASCPATNRPSGAAIANTYAPAASGADGLGAVVDGLLHATARSTAATSTVPRRMVTLRMRGAPRARGRSPRG